MAETTRLAALKTLANQLPVANRRIAQQQQAAKDMQIQQLAAQAPQGIRTAPAAAQTGAALAQQTGQQNLQNIQQGAAQLGQIGQTAVQEQALADAARVTGLQQGARTAQLDSVQRFANLNRQLKDELYDKQMQFKRDELGRTLLNERQLLDYAAMNARSDEEFKNFQQAAEQTIRMKEYAIDLAGKKVLDALEFEAKKAEARKDREAANEIRRLQREAENQIAKTKRKAANKAAAWQSVGAIAGGAIGAYAGQSAAGAQAGAQIGGGAGSAAAANT